MSTSSARPENLIQYAADMVPQYEAMPSTGRLDELIGQVQAKGADYAPSMTPPGPEIKAALTLAQELDQWAGAVGAAFAAADGSGAELATVDDAQVIKNLPPLLADPPAEVRQRVKAGQDLYDRLAKAAEERDREEIESIMKRLESLDDATLAGFASRIGEGGQEKFEEMLRDGMRPKDRPGVWGGVVDFFAGAWDAIKGVLTFIWDQSTVRMIVDPDGWWQSKVDLAEGVKQAVTDPGEFFEALIDWEGFLDNPERWLGQFAPDVIIAIATAGGGTATRGTKALAKLDELADFVRTTRALKRLDVDASPTAAFNRLSARLDGDLLKTRDALVTYLTGKGVPEGQARTISNRLAGNEFNRQRRGAYPLSEIELGPIGTRGVRLDAYDPVKGEIVSRKLTQLGDVTPATAKTYIDELVRKYPDGADIKVTPTVLAKAERAGIEVPTKLEGQQFLEVPVQKGSIPKEVLDYARKQEVIIRDVDGLVLNP